MDRLIIEYMNPHSKQFLMRLSKHIVNVVRFDESNFVGKTWKRLSMNEILSKVENEYVSYVPLSNTSNSSKCRVRVYTEFGWKNIETLVSTLESDKEYDVLLIQRRYNAEDDNYIKRKGRQYILLEDYDVKKDCPDVFVAYLYGNSTLNNEYSMYSFKT